MQNDLSFRPNPPWSPPASPDDPDNQIANFEITEYSDYDQEELIFHAFGVLTGMVAQADYDFQLIEYPGSTLDQVFGINNRGDVVGNGSVDPDGIPYVYDTKKGGFTNVTPVAGFDQTSVLGISDKGVLVGSVRIFDPDPPYDDVEVSGLIIDQKGASTVFDHPDAVSFTQARGVNNKGLVSGYRDTPTGDLTGFIYDPKTGTFTDIDTAPSIQTIAHGINSKGDVVGSAIFFPADDPCPPSSDPTGTVRYGWLRTTDGNVTYFDVNGGRTSARGITDSGTIAGFVTETVNFTTKGFVVELDGSQCQSVAIAASDLLVFPGFDGLWPEGITNSGVIVGSVEDDTNSHGFIATPDKKGKKGKK